MVKKMFLLQWLILATTALCAQKAVIKGAVLKPDGSPAALANVHIRDAQVTTTTNSAGQFMLQNIEPGEKTLSISLTGFVAQQVAVTVVSGQNQLPDIHLQLNAIELEQVLITAEKQATDLQRTSMAVSAISGKQIRERKIQEMSDLILSVPNLMTMTMGAPTLNAISIRGILTFSMDPAVGIYIDGVPMFDGYSSSLQLQDIERVEVLRGPQSTLYGRNALGGIINVITQKPTNNFKGFVETGWGNYGSQRYSAGVSGPLVKNKLFAGFSGVYDTRNGFYTNRYNNKKYDKPETFNGNFYLKYLASDKLSFTFNSKAERNNVRGTFPYVVGRDNAFDNPYSIDQDGANIEKRTVWSNSLTATYQLKGAQLYSITSFSYLNDTYRDYDADYTPYDITLFESPLQEQKTWVQEFRIVTDNHKRLKFTGGLFGFLDRKTPVSKYVYGEDAVAYYPDAPFTSSTYSDKKVRGVAAYGNLTYAITDQFSITAGLRYDHEDRKMTMHSEYEKAPDPPMVSPEQKLKGHNTALSPKLSLAWFPKKTMQLYASYARGYRPGGFNQYISDPALLNYGQEYTDNYELGFKSEWLNHRLRINAAAFYTYWKDQQQTLSLPEIYTQNLGKMSASGAELEVTGLAAKGLEIRYNLGLVFSDYKTLILPDLENPAENKNYEGKKQIFTPVFTSALSVSYQYPITKTISLFAVPEWKYVGKQYMNYYNDLKQDPFSLLNVNLGLRWKGYEIGLWGKNLGDARYLAFAYATQPAASTPLMLGIPRTWGVNLRARF